MTIMKEVELHKDKIKGSAIKDSVVGIKMALHRGDKMNGNDKEWSQNEMALHDIK